MAFFIGRKLGLQLKNNESGFSLVEAMIGISIMVFASIGFMNFMKAQQKSQKTVEIKAELLEVKGIIQQTISTMNACEATFVGMAPGDSLKEVRTSKDLSKPPFLKTGEKFRQYSVYVKSMKMLTREEQKDPSRNISDAGIEANGVGYAFIEVTFGKNAKEKNGQEQTFFGGNDHKAVFPIRAVFANYTLLAGCQKDSTLSTKCQQNAAAQGAGDNYNALFVRDESPPFAEKVFEIEGCGSPGGYMLECNIYKDTFPITSCAVI